MSRSSIIGIMDTKLQFFFNLIFPVFFIFVLIRRIVDSFSYEFVSCSDTIL